MYKNYRFSRRLLITISLVIGMFFLGISFIFIIEPPKAVFDFSWILDSLRNSFEILVDAGLLRSLFFTGIIILILLGAPHIFAGLLLVARMKVAIFLAMIASMFLIISASVMTIVFPDRALIWILLVLGIVELIISYVCYVTYYKYSFYFNELDYTDINKKNKENIVVFYSRDFYIKKFAYEYANKHKYNICEIKPKEDLFSNKGYFKLVYATLFSKEIEVEPIDLDLTQFKRVYLITGVIFKNIAAPVINFCKQNSGKINSVEYNFVHYTPFIHKYSIDKLDKLLNVKHASARATCMHFGKVLNFNFVHYQNNNTNDEKEEE